MSSKEKIIKAAYRIFAEKGRRGARVSEIASLAGINKAMIYYYFSSKDHLYHEVLKSIFVKMTPKVERIMEKDIDLRTKFERLVQFYFNFFEKNPYMIKLFLREIVDGAKELKDVIDELKEEIVPIKEAYSAPFLKDLFESGKLRDLDPLQTWISILGLIFIYFLGKPLMDKLYGFEFESEKEILRKRKENIIEILFGGIIKEEERK